MFEAASVRPSTSGSNGVSGGCRGSDTISGGENRDIPLGRCVISAGRLSHLIAVAWQLNSMAMLHNAPDWVIGGDERFDIQAKAEDLRATEGQLLEMLQHLLEDRFQLKWHRENHEEHGFNKGNPTVTISPHKVSMAVLASFLSTFGPGGTVADETGLKGDYNFTLTYNETDRTFGQYRSAAPAQP
ncbi:MAG TPA: TIGR03435 family protein [Bryobacteraceae bacterium]|nr:TIGR03435 family protein [Bryobacteraceae bacterium]